MALLWETPTSPPFLMTSEARCLPHSSLALSPNPLHTHAHLISQETILLKQNLSPFLLSPPCSKISHSGEQPGAAPWHPGVPGLQRGSCSGAPEHRLLSPSQLTPQKHTFSCHQTQPVSKSCVESALLSVALLLGIAKCRSLWHSAQTCGKKITQN